MWDIVFVTWKGLSSMLWNRVFLSKKQRDLGPCFTSWRLLLYISLFNFSKFRFQMWGLWYLFQWIGSQDEYFWRPIKLNRYSLHAQMILKLLPCLLQKINIKFCLLLWKHILILKCHPLDEIWPSCICLPMLKSEQSWVRSQHPPTPGI